MNGVIEIVCAKCARCKSERKKNCKLVVVYKNLIKIFVLVFYIVIKNLGDINFEVNQIVNIKVIIQRPHKDTQNLLGSKKMIVYITEIMLLINLIFEKIIFPRIKEKLLKYL